MKGVPGIYVSVPWRWSLNINLPGENQMEVADNVIRLRIIVGAV